MLHDIAGLWWETITGPLRLVEQTAAYVQEGKSVLLCGADCLPWREEFRDYISQKINVSRIESIQWEEACARPDVVPRLLRDIAPQYLNLCPADEKRRIKYLKETHLLSRTLVWMDLIFQDEVAGITGFVSDYRGRDLNTEGVFVVELSGQSVLSHLSSSVAVIRCRDFITETDMNLFAAILAEDSRNIPAELKQYAAQVVSGLAGTNAQQIKGLLSQIEFGQQDPIQEARELLGSPFEEEERLGHVLWKAQLQTAFPGIEMERERLIRQHQHILQEALETEYWDPKKDETGYVTQFRLRVEEPYGLEFGALTYIKGLRKNEDREQPLAAIEDQDWWERVFFLHECRNRLAHHGVCSPHDFHCLMKLIHGGKKSVGK